MIMTALHGSRTIVSILISFILVQYMIGGFAFVASIGSTKQRISLKHLRTDVNFRSRRNGNFFGKFKGTESIAAVELYAADQPLVYDDNNTSVAVKVSIRDTLAKGVGYLMGAGSLLLFSPIIFKILKFRNADGFAVSTWIMNLVGMLLAVAYPVKMGFPPSTYLEVVSVILQCSIILGLICFYKGFFQLYVYCLVPFMLLFGWFLRSRNTPMRLTQLIQAASIVLSVYANVPQIILTFRLKKASWSWITAALSSSGCLVRVLTTLQLTQDKLALFGYSMGFVTNFILLLQVFYYN